MMKRILMVAIALLIGRAAQAQTTPEIYSWIRNTTGATGYAGILTNVQTVMYTTSDVYVSCTCIPSYPIGAWPGNPNVPANQNYVFDIPRNPTMNTGTLTPTPLGHIGIWSNGVSIFNADDGQSYNNAGVWHRNAYYWEGSGFDSCLGHPQQQGEYHHHVNPKCLYNDLDSTHHSPIIGYAFDGYPVYGAYAYTNTNGTGAIKRMKSSYQLRSITTRTTLPDGSTASSAGPAVSATYPLGCFIQDFVYVAGAGDLDDHNGRVCVTPEYPGGTYAYFITIDSAMNPIFPFVLGATYYGIVKSTDVGPGSGHVTPTGNVYTNVTDITKNIKLQFVPNPVKDYLYIYMDVQNPVNIKGSLYDGTGKLLKEITYLQPSIAYSVDFTQYPAGIYYLHLEANGITKVEKIVKSN
jgi:hypothetical protein